MRTPAFFFAVLILAAPLAADDAMLKAKQTMTKAGDTVQQVAKDAKAVAGAAKDVVEGAVDRAEAVVQAAPMDVLQRSVGSHWHNKLVHFPVALGIFGCLFVLATRRWPQYLWPSRVLLGSALVLGVAALRTGEAAEEAIEGTSLHNTLEWHETSAKLMLAMLALTLLLTWFPSLKRWSWIVAVLACAMVLFTGALGGALAAA